MSAFFAMCKILRFHVKDQALGEKKKENHFLIMTFGGFECSVFLVKELLFRSPVALKSTQCQRKGCFLKVGPEGKFEMKLRLLGLNCCQTTFGL